MERGFREAAGGEMAAGGSAHLGVVEIPLSERAAPTHLAAEQAAKRGEAQLVPRFAAQLGQQDTKVALAPAAPAHRDKAEEALRQAGAEQLVGAREQRTVEAGNVGREIGNGVE